MISLCGASIVALWWFESNRFVLVERYAKEVEQAFEIIVGEEGDADFAFVLG